MPFTPTVFNEGVAPGISAAELNKLGTQYDQALADISVDAAAVLSIIANKIKAGAVSDTTDGDGLIDVDFAQEFLSTPVVIVQLEGDVDYYAVVTAKSTTGFTVKLLKSAHVHSQGDTGAEAVHTHSQGNTGAEAAHTHTQGNTGAEAAHTHANPSTQAVSAGTPAGTVGAEASHTHTQGVTGAPSATVAASSITLITRWGAASSGGPTTTAIQGVASINDVAPGSSTHTHTNPSTGAGSSHTHSFTGSALGTHAHTQGATGAGSSHAHTNPTTGAGSSHTHSNPTSGAGASHAHSNPSTASANAGNALISTAVVFSYIAMIP